jgi:hypothetical protein
LAIDSIIKENTSLFLFFPLLHILYDIFCSIPLISAACILISFSVPRWQDENNVTGVSGKEMSRFLHLGKTVNKTSEFLYIF